MRKFVVTGFNMAAAWRSNLAKHAREIRFHLCQTSKSSQGVRDFLEKNYVDIKKQNPKFPILVRECSGVQPKVYARYSHGVENSAELSNLSSDEVSSVLEGLISAGGPKH